MNDYSLGSFFFCFVLGVELLNNDDGSARVASAEKVEETSKKDKSRSVTWNFEEHASANNRFSALSEDYTEAL